MRGLKKQYELRRYPDSQINIVKIDGKDALVYREFQSKTRQGGYLTGVKIQQGCLIVSAQGLGLDAWLNCLGSIDSIDSKALPKQKVSCCEGIYI